MDAPRWSRRLLAAAGLCLSMAAGTANAGDYVSLPGGSFASVIANDASGRLASVEAFEMRVTPVTQEEFERFVERQPQWRRDRIASVLADAGYLSDWASPTQGPVGENPHRPVTHVSWFAAQAFCESEGARLPSWSEWEYAAAADETRRDARADPQWRSRILSWYSRPSTQPLRAVGAAPIVYGLRDMHALVWEWVDDFNALLVDADSRSGDDPDKLKFCGAGAINLQQRENYAVLMRVALLSSLRASDSTASLGFRCVRPIESQTREAP
jgi:formylglycine-generating enzyme required for sulfatase activity